MHETKSKWFKKVLRATLCFLVVCGSLSAMLFVPNKEEETPQVPIEKELCVYSAPLQVSPTPTPISIEEEPAEPEADLNPYAELSPTDTEKELLACMAYSEAGNQQRKATEKRNRYQKVIICFASLFSLPIATQFLRCRRRSSLVTAVRFLNA